MGLQAHNDGASRASPARKCGFTLRYVVLLGDSLAVELPALTRSALVRIQVPQPQFPIKIIIIKVDYHTAKRIRYS